MAQIAVCRIDEVPAETALCKRLPGGQRVAVARLTGHEPAFAVFENLVPACAGAAWPGTRPQQCDRVSLALLPLRSNDGKGGRHRQHHAGSLLSGLG